MKNLLLILALFLLFGQTKSMAQCNPDITPPVANCVSELSRDVRPNISFPITVNASDFNAGSFDACDPSNVLGYFIELAPQSATPPSTTSLDFTANDAGDQNIVFWVVDAAGNAATATAILHLSICQATLSLTCNDLITVSLGVNNTYELDAFEMLEGGPYCDYNAYQVRLDQLGSFQNTLTLTPEDLGIHLLAVSGSGNTCWGTLVVAPGILNTTCPQLFVDIATNGIRPCFNGAYAVYYANVSTITVPNTYVDVLLADDLEYISSNIPATALGNNVFRFETGELSAGESGFFILIILPAAKRNLAVPFVRKRIFTQTLFALEPWHGQVQKLAWKAIA